MIIKNYIYFLCPFENMVHLFVFNCGFKPLKVNKLSVVYRGRLVHSVLLMNASIMQIQTMTQIQTKNPATYFNTGPRLL